MIELIVSVGLIVILYNLLFSGPPYVPTLARDIERVFDELEINENDFLVDLGSGDGRALIESSNRGAKAEGVELNPVLVLITMFRLRKNKLAKVRWGSMWRYQIPKETTHIFIFGAGSFMKRFAKKIEDFTHDNGEVIVISYGFGFGEREIKQIIGPFRVYQF